MRSSVIPETAPSFLQQFAGDVRRDLSLSPRQLQSKYLYDGLGSSLFETICRLPWYRITRAEHRLLSAHAGAIVGHLRDPLAIVELGPGGGQKMAVIAESLASTRRSVRVHLVDISAAALELSERTLGAFREVSVVGHRSSYEEGLRRVALTRANDDAMLVLFLGSNIGNFDPPADEAFLANIRRSLGAGDALLLGADLIKPVPELLLAYDDPLGVTAAFNKNLLLRINRELNGSFDLDLFRHEACWSDRASRVEMRLVSRCHQLVEIPGADCSITLEPDEWIWTESAYKYQPEQLVSLGRAAGFVTRQQWIDVDARFALTLFAAE